MTVQYDPAVEGELRRIRRQCRERSPGLGVKFIDEFDRQVLALAATPGRGIIVTADIRRCLMRRFPCAIYSRQVGATSIRETAVKHQRRHPGYGRDRT